MKKVYVILLILSILPLPACGYSQEELDAATAAAYEEGYAKGFEDGYQNGHDDGFDDGYDEGYSALKPVPMPASGEILSGEETKWRSEITVTASFGSSYVVTLKDSNESEVITFFVRSGDTVTIGVPKKKLYVYFASGDKWYGYGRGLMFGEDTVYTKDDELLDFSKYSWEYTLYPITNGNFTETPSTENEFF